MRIDTACQTRYGGTSGSTCGERLRSTAQPQYPVARAPSREQSSIRALTVASLREFGGIYRVAPQALPIDGAVRIHYARLRAGENAGIASAQPAGVPGRARRSICRSS